MIETLNLVAGAVSTKDMLPVLTHFCIYDGRIQGSNGRVAIDAPCSELAGLDAIVPAEKFLKAVNACQGEPQLKLNADKTRLTISKGRFRATVSLLQVDDYPREENAAGEKTTFAQPVLPMLRMLAPFVSDDASRPWACSILLRDGYAYATNNVVVARTPYKWTAGDLALSAAGIDEMLRIGDEPTAITVTEHGCWMHYTRCWLKMQLLQGGWPEALSKLMAQLATAQPPPLPAGLLDDVQLLKPFFPDEKMPIVLTGPEGVSTQDGQHSAAVEGGGLPKGAFRLESLSLVLAIATHADLAASPSPWRGDNIEGLLSGVRV